MNTIEKDPAAELDYGFTWRHWLALEETIASSSWTITAATSDVDENPLQKDPDVASGWEGPVTYVWLVGGTVGRFYRVVNRVTTNAGRSDERTFSIKVVDR